MEKPSVAVLMATHNGSRFLAEQIESFALQENVRLTLIVSDDSSTDGTVLAIDNICRRFGMEFELLSADVSFGGAAKNFFRLIRDVESSGFQYFAFADQDDIWKPDKLATSIRAIQSGADAVSSNVTAFWPDRKKEVIKSQPQRSKDYLFESAGPGCTFLLSAPLFQKIQDLARTHQQYFDRCALHDWAIYAVTRGLGYRWEILPESTLLYRQHENNVVGARRGLRAAIKRFSLIREGWVYVQVQAVLDLVERCCPRVDIAAIRQAASEPSLRNRVILCLLVPQLRRRFADRCMTLFLFASGLFWPKQGVLLQQEKTR